MAPGLRSGRTGHPGASGGDPGGLTPQRTDAGGERRCLRTGLRAGAAAGMLAHCLLSVAGLSLLVRCAVAAEERSTYDASGSSPLPSDPVVTGVPARPLAEEVPFPVVRSDSDSETEGEGLSGRPAFSSVLTVMAGTVKHPGSLGQGRTSPTITRDETHTTQWPSRSSSLGSDVSSSSYTGEKTLPAGSGLIFNTFAWALHSTASAHVSGNGNASLSPLSPAMSLPSITSLSSSAPSTSSVSSSIVSLFHPSPSTERILRAGSSQSQRMIPTPAPHAATATLTLGGFQGWTEGTTAARSTSFSVSDLEATVQTIESTTQELSGSPSEASSEKSNKVTKHSFYSSADAINAVSEIHVKGANTKGSDPPAFVAFTSSSTEGLSYFDVSIGPIQTHSKGLNLVSSNNPQFSTLFSSSGESHAVTSDGQTPSPPSALTSARPKGSSASNDFTMQTLNPKQSVDTNRTVVTHHALDHKNNAAVSLLSSHVGKRPKSPATAFPHSGSLLTVSLEPQPGKTSLSAITKLTRSRSGPTSPEHASNPADLLMAVGHSSPRVPAIDIIYSQGEKAGAELGSASSQAHLNNSLSLTELGPQSTSDSVLHLSSQTETSSLFEFLHSQKSITENVQEAVTQVELSEDAQTPLNLLAPINNRTKSPSEPEELAQNMTQKTTYESSSASTQSLNLYLTHYPRRRDHTDSTSEALPSSEFELADQAEAAMPPQITSPEGPLQTRETPGSPHRFYTPVFALRESEQTVVSSAQTSAHIKSEAAFEVQTRTENNKTLQASSAHKWQRNKPTEVFYGDTAKTSPLYQVIEERTLIRDNVFYKKAALSGQLTTHFPSFITTKDAITVREVSEGSGEKPARMPLSASTSDAASERPKGAAPSTGRYEEPSAFLRSEITPTWRAKSSSHSQGPITSPSQDESNFYFRGQTSRAPAIYSAVKTSSGDWINSVEALGASTGTKQMTPYTGRKATEPMPFLTSAFKLESTSSGFDGAQSNLPADGQSYERSMLQNRQEHKADKSNLTDWTAAASHPFSLRPNVEQNPSFTDATRLSEEGSPNIPSATLGSTSAASVNTDTTSAWGSDGFLPGFRSTANFVSPSQAAPLASLYRSERSPAQADVHSTNSAFDSAVTLSGNPSHSFPDTNTAGRAVASALQRSTFPARVASSSPSFYPSPPSATQPLSFIKHAIFVPPSSENPLDMSSTEPSMFPSSAAVLPIKSTFSPSSLTSSLRSDHSQKVTETFVLAEAEMDELGAGTSQAVAHTFPKEREASLAPSQSVRIPLSGGPTERTAQVSPLTPRQDTTTASVALTTSTVASATQSNNPTASMPSPRVTTQLAAMTAPPDTPVTRRTTTTTRTLTSRRTFMPPIPRTSPPRLLTTIFISPFTTTTESPPQQCNITEKLWVKTVVSIYVRRNRLDSIQRQNLRRGLSQGLRKALNDSSAQAQVETVFGSPNMTVAYHVTGADIVYPPSVVLDGLASYGRDRLIADLRQYLPMVTALPLPVTLWRSIPATGFQLKTVLQFVGAGDDPRSCRFSQMMEQRLEKVFSEAQAKVLHASSKLAVQMLSVSQAAGSPAVSLVYTVRNGTVFLNGTSASNLLGQLSAELVGYFLFYPPLIIAEPLEYHNLNTSIATRDFWLVTVIQDVDNASLEGQYQSFASLMEQRLAELFVLAGQQGTRFRRATTVGSFTVQMVSIRRVSGLKNPAEMTYYVQHNGIPLIGTSAAKVLNTVDSQTMALTLGYFVQLQAEPVVKNPPNNLWILAAVLAPISVVTLIIIIITAVLCRKNKNDFKADAIGNLNPRAKMAYRRDVGYYHQPVQGFDYAKQHLGQQGGDEETLPASQDTLVMSLQIRDTPLSLEKALQQDGTGSKKSLTADKHKSKLPSEDGSVISNESEKLNSCRGLTVPKVTAQQKLTKEETRKRDDPYDTSSGSLQLISIKPMAAPTNYSHPASAERSRDSVLINGEVNLALKQKSDIEHYRNKLRLKAKRKGYYDFPSTNGSSGDRALVQRQRPGDERAAGEHGRPLEPDDERGSTYVKSHRRQSQVGQTAYRSRQSLSSPSPGGTEMDLLVMRERPRRGIRNSGYDTEPELIEETNVDRLVGPRAYMYGRGLKGHSETSTLSSQPSIDEVRQQMHLLLEEAFSLASGGQSTSGRHAHHHHQQPPSDHYSSAPPPLPYADVVTSAPGTMTCERGGLQWVPSYGTDVYQCSLPKPAFRFTQLPEMTMGSPPPLPPRTGPPHGTPLRRSTSDLGPKGRSSETSVAEIRSQHDNNPYGPTTRAALPPITAEQPVSNYSGNPITAVYAIPATRSGYSEYFVSTPPTSYHSPSWMSYPPEPEDVPPQWADSVPLPGYVEAFPHPRYPQGSPTRLPLEYNQTLEQPPTAPSTASQQSLPQVLKDMDSLPLSSLSTSALVQAIRQEVAKLAKKQNDMFEF